MYAVVKVDMTDLSKEGFKKPQIFKGYKTLTGALKCAAKRNNMISTQVFGYRYLVWDYENKKVAA